MQGTYVGVDACQNRPGLCNNVGENDVLGKRSGKYDSHQTKELTLSYMLH